jgi:formamidopyrimidine-DNA glycosylase
MTMPELPEVETVRRALEARLLGRRIVAVDCRRPVLRRPVPVARLEQLVGSTFVAARRRSKFLLLSLDPAATLLVHLGMTGNLLFGDGDGIHDHVRFGLDQGPPLVYRDPRRFGLMNVLLGDEEARCAELARLGPEPLTPTFNVDHLQAICRGRRRPIKSVLMDNGVVVGVGNIYASESLFRAGIRPTTPAGNISRGRLERLVSAVRAVLVAAIDAGGTTITDYQGAGEGGRFQHQLAVYGRRGQSCRVCDAPVHRLVLAGRSTFYCRRCQH